MKFEKNSVIGIALLAILFIAYFYFTRQGQLELEAKQKQIRDSIAAIQPVIKDTAVALEAKTDTAAIGAASGPAHPAHGIASAGCAGRAKRHRCRAFTG